MTTEFEDLQQEILDLKVAVTESADSQEMGERQEQGESQKPKGPEVWYNPSSWSPERQQQATDIAIVGGVVVGGALLLKWIFGKTAEKAHAAREKAGNVIHTVGNGIGKIRRGIMWSVGIGVTAVLGYFGIQAYRQVNKLREQQAKYDEALARMQSTTDQGREVARRELEEARRKLEEIRNEEKLPALPEIVQEGEETLSVAMAMRALPLQYDVVHSIDPQGHSPKPYLRDAEEILTLTAQKDKGPNPVRMQQFFDCMDGEAEGHVQLLFSIYGDTVNGWTPEIRKQKTAALHFVLGFLKKYRSVIERSGKLRDEDPGSLTLAEALNVFAGAPSAMEGLALNLAASTATSLMKLELPNPIPALEEFFAKDDLYSERMVELVLQPLLNESSSDMNDEAQRERYAGNARAFPHIS